MTMLPKPGDRIRVLSMPDDPNPIPIGELGTVVSVVSHGTGKSAWHQVDVKWDNGRTLMLMLPVDRFEILQNVAGA